MSEEGIFFTKFISNAQVPRSVDTTMYRLPVVVPPVTSTG